MKKDEEEDLSHAKTGSSKKIVLQITGMTCAHCARSVERIIQSNPGIIKTQVVFNERKGEVLFDTDKVSAEVIVQSINQSASYQATIAANTEQSNCFDLIIIGGGSAAFSAAIRAESLGIKTLMVNAGLPFGGTCVNVGCVPSKMLMRAGETVFHAKHSNFSGILPKGAEINFSKIKEQKNALVQQLQQSKYMDVVKDFKHLTLKQGRATFVNATTIDVDGKEKFTAKKFIIATGASTRIPNIEGLDKIDFLTSATLFDLDALPDSITILGAGYIALETAMTYNRFGCKVQIIEFTDRVLRSQMPDISTEIEMYLKNEGIEIFPNSRVLKFEQQNNAIIMHCKNAEGAFIKLIEKGKVLVATGIEPNTRNMGLEAIGITLDDKRHIAVNSSMQTNLPNIYAVGDVVNTPAFVYTAAYEGKVAVENAFTDKQRIVDYTALPWVVFTDPQVAGVGLDEAQAAAANIPYDVSKLTLDNVPRSLAANDTRGFIKLIRNKTTDTLIGARIVAPEGGELIELLSMAIKHKTTIKELAENIYPYLTLGEGIKLAAIAFGTDVNKLSCCAS